MNKGVCVKKIIVLILVSLVSLYAYDASIDIVKNSDKLPSIIVQDATNINFNSKKIEKKIFKLLIGDLKISANFIVDDSYIRTSYNGNFKNNFQSDKHVNLILRFKLENDGPFLAHKMIIDANNAIGAPSIDWMERFVIFSKITGKRKSDIVISDYTLSYQKTVVTGGLNIFPKWADDKQDAFYYSSYNGRIPVLYRVNLDKGTRTKIIKTKRKERLTKFPGIDVSGNFIDNETRFAFVSDRLGYPNIFAKRFNINAPVEQLVYQGRNISSFSSYNNYIVFSRREGDSEFGKNSFNLYLISTKTQYIRQLTATGKNYFPRFANKGETIMFIKNYKGQSALGIIRLYSNKSFLFPLKIGKIQSIDW